MPLPGSPVEMSRQDRTLLVLAAEGYTFVEIGKRLFLSPTPVDRYRARPVRRLRLRHRSELVRFALRTVLLSAEGMGALGFPSPSGAHAGKGNGRGEG
jgi:DNA-binding CsgD family transcriptional regulator